MNIVKEDGRRNRRDQAGPTINTSSLREMELDSKADDDETGLDIGNRSEHPS